VVVVQHAGLAPLLPRRQGSRRARRWVAELHNVASVTSSALADIAPGRRQRWVHRAQARRAARLERWIVDGYDRVVTVSEEDAAALPGSSYVVPNGVDLDGWAMQPLVHHPRVVFTGTLSYLPNVDGIEWFCRLVWPAVRARVPEAVLDIVGRAPVASVLALGEQPGVEVHADVPDVRPFVQQARVCVVPLRAGSGTRLKVLEAWAAGRAVVGTPIGLGGLSSSPALVAESPQRLADGVVEALTDEATATRLARAGRALVEERYDWRVVGARYADWLGTLGSP